MTTTTIQPRKRGPIYGARRTVSLRLPPVVHDLLHARLDGRQSVNQYLTHLLERELGLESALSRAKVALGGKLPQGQVCDSCGIGTVALGTRDWWYEWDGYRTLIPDVTAWFCSSCHEVYATGQNAARLERIKLEFREAMMEQHHRWSQDVIPELSRAKVGAEETTEMKKQRKKVSKKVTKKPG